MWARREFLKAAGAGFLAGLAPRPAAALATAELVLASACKTRDGRFAAILVTERGEVISELALPDRGHDVARCPITERLVIFARRPGTFAVVFDRAGRSLHTLTSPGGRHFFGHGVFSPDGRLLYATENAFETAEGMIGVYDATDGFARIGEFSSGGMDPHELLLVGDNVICVANGGIETHPDYGRQKLNLSTMAPNISWIDRDTGQVLARHSLSSNLHRVSLRHLAAAPDGSVWVGGQYEGPAEDVVPLLVRVRQDDDVFTPDLPEAQIARLSNYVGSVAASEDGSAIIATSPVGGAILTFDTQSGASQMQAMTNVCGAAFAGRSPVLSTGEGEITDRDGRTRTSPVFFDNHLVVA